MLAKSLLFSFLSIGILVLTACSDDPTPTFKVMGASTSGARSTLSVLPRLVDLSRTSGTPTSFKITLYSAWISTSADCSNPVLLQDYGTAGQQLDLFASPTLFSGSPADGTYPCLILKTHDNFKFKADATAVAAHAGCQDTTTEYTFDIYRNGDDDDGDWIDMDGESIDATGSKGTPGQDTIFVFASTVVSSIRANGVAPNNNQTAELTGALIVPGQTTYYWDATDGIDNSEENSTNYCWVENVTSGFR